MSRPTSPNSVCDDDVVTTVAEASVDPAEAIERTMDGMMRGDLSEVPVFVQSLFAYFEEGMRPGMSSREASVELGRKAAFVLGTLFSLARRAQEEEMKEEETHVERQTRRALDVVMGAWLFGNAWKLAVLYLLDTFVPFVTMLHLACVLGAASLFTTWHVSDAVVFFAVYTARQQAYKGNDAYALLGMSAAMCYAA